MAANIKGLTVEIGGDTTKLGKALESVNKQTRSLSSELGDINRLLKLDPGNTDLLAQKQKVLAQAISETGKKLDTLKTAEKQVQEQFERGEVSEEQVRALKREIIATEKKLGSYEKAAKETAEALDNVGEESEDAAEKSDKLGDSLSTGVKVGLAAVVAGCTAAVAAIASSVEATQQYRTEMGKLNTAFTTNGHSVEAAQQTYEELQGVLGETDQAVEAANHLAKLTKNEADLSKWTDICTGVYATFGASLPIEGLTEASNETAKVGAVTGPLADALNWAGVSEDRFNESLEKCSSEQERQQLIMETLVDLYDDAAAAYEETNAEVIRSNKATEKLNKVWADVGSKAAPIVNTFREGVAELGEAFVDLVDDTDVREFQLTCKKGFNELADKTLPKMINSLEWCVENFDAIQSVAVGAATAVVAYKVAVIAAEIAQKGLVATIKATTVAQKALSLAQAATPWGLAAVAIAGVVTGLVAYKAKVEEAAQKTEHLTLEEQELAQSAKDAADSFREQQEAVVGNIGGIQSQMSHVTDLANELQTLVDKNGAVEESDRARVQFILNELNSALGTEYSMVDGVVQKYGELEANINDVIRAKTANALLEAGNEAYVTALQNEQQAWEAVNVAEKDYLAQKELVKQKEAELAQARADYDAAVLAGDQSAMTSAMNRVNSCKGYLANEQAVLTEKKAAYDQAAIDYGNYSSTITNYEAAQEAALQGNYDTTVQLMQGKNAAYSNHADVVDTETRNVLDSLQKEAVDAGVKAAETKKNFEAGVGGYTQEMVDEAEKGYEDALDAYATAYDDAHGVGKDIGGGLSDGMESKRTSVVSKIKSIVGAIISAARNEADSHSPSRKMIAFGEDMGEGAVIGLENMFKAATAAGRGLAQGAAKGVAAAQKRLDNHKVYNSVSLAEEAGYWDAIREQYDEGTEDRIAADKKYFDAKKAANDKLTQLETTYADGVKAVQDKLTKDVEKATDAYNNAVAKRQSSLLSSMGLFDLFGLNDATSKDSLLFNLETQVGALEAFDAVMERLSSRKGMDAGLLKELEGMGPKSLLTLQQIANMSDDEFAKYVGLYQRKSALALDRATDENAGLKAQTEADIQQLTAQAALDIAALGTKYTEGLAEVGVNIAPAAKAVGTAIVEKIGEGITEAQGPLQASLTTLVGSLSRMLSGAADPSGGLALQNTSAGQTAAAGTAATAAVLAKLNGIYDRLGRLQMVLDSGTLVGEIIDKIDMGLADVQLLRARGV